MVVGALSTVCLSAIEGIIMCCTNFAVPDPKLPYTIVTDASGTLDVLGSLVTVSNQVDSA